jgi:hypothetical protein
MRNKPPSQRRRVLELDDGFRRVTRFAVAMLREAGDVEEHELRARVVVGFREALTLEEPRTRLLDVVMQDPADKELGGPQRFIRADDVATLFLIAFWQRGLDRSNLHMQEHWWSVTDKAVDEAISDPMSRFTPTGSPAR